MDKLKISLHGKLWWDFKLFLYGTYFFNALVSICYNENIEMIRQYDLNCNMRSSLIYEEYE